MKATTNSRSTRRLPNSLASLPMLNKNWAAKAEVIGYAGVKNELAQQHTAAAALVRELAAAKQAIERLKAESTGYVELRSELAQQHTAAAGRGNELTAAREEIERLKAEANAEDKRGLAQEHATAAALAGELAAAREEMERLKSETGAAVERARAWRTRFVEELERNEVVRVPQPELAESGQVRSTRPGSRGR
jgi:hypothetical protein